MTKRERPLPRRVGQRLAQALAIALLFVAALLLGIVLHLDTRPIRAAATRAANWALADVLYGRIELEGVHELTLSRVRLHDARLFDEYGNRVLQLHEVSVLLPAPRALLGLLLDRKQLRLAFPHARAERGFVAVLDDPEHGGVTLERALTPRPVPKPAARARDRAPRQVFVSFEHVELGRVRGQFSNPALAELSPTLAGVRGTLSFDPNGVQTQVERFGAIARGPGGAPLRGTGSFSLRSPGPMRAEFSGFFDQTEIQARAHLEAGRLRGSLRAPRITPEAGRELWEPWPVLKPLSLRAELDGSLHDASFRVRGAARAQRSELAVQATIEAHRDLHIDAAAKLREFDLQLVLAEAPASSVDARAQFTFTQNGATPQASLKGTTEATQLAGVAVPPLRFAFDGWPPLVNARLEALDPTAPVSAELSASDGELSGKASVRDLDLAKQAWAPRGLRGLTSLSAQLQLQGEQLSIELQGDARAVRVSEVVGLERLSFELQGTNPWRELTQASFALDATAAGVSLGKLRFEAARFAGRASLAGVTGALQLSDSDGRRVQLRGTTTLQGQLSDLELHARRGSLALEARIPRLDPSVPEVRVAALKLEGPNMTLTASGHYRPGHVRAKVTARNLQLHRVGRPLGWASAAVTGAANIDLDLTLAPDLQRGRLDVELERVSFGGWGQTNAHLQATLHEDSVAGELALRNDLGFGLEGQWDLALAGPPLSAASWSAAAGTSQLFLHGVDLMALGLLVESPAVRELEGTLGARVSLHRPVGGGLPSALFELGVSGLAATLPALNPDAPTGPLTVYVNGAYDAPTRTLDATSVVDDVHGRLATLTGRAEANLEAFLRDPWRALQDFIHQPLQLSLQLPRRRLRELPWLERRAVEGWIEGRLALAGSLADPQLQLWLATEGLRAAKLSRAAALDFTLLSRYTPVAGDLEVELGANLRDRRVLQGRFAARLPWDESPWEHLQSVDGRLEFYRLQLENLAPLAELDLGGTLSGRVELVSAQAARGPVLAAALELSELASGRAALGSGTLALEGAPGELSGQLRLDRGLGRVNVQFGATGSKTGVPFPVRVDNLEARVEATRLDAAALAPLVGSSVSRLSGRVDGQLSLYLKRVGESDDWRSSLSGEADVSRGSAYIDPLGLELRDIRLHATAIPRGDGTILELKNVTAKARSQRTNLEGSGSFVLHGVRLVTGSAQLLLRSVPLTLQGRNLGTASGRLTAQLERRETGWDVPGPHAGGPYLLVNAVLDSWRLKAAASASRPLIDLEPTPGVVVLQEEPASPDDDLLPYRFIVELGQDVQFSLAEMELPVDGQLNIAYAGETTLNGTLEFERGGRLPLLGRVFQVVDGSLRLNPNAPSNPNVDLTLEGRSADGSPVFVTISGTLQEPLTDPPASRLRELLGGGTATALSGGVQALGLGNLLGDRVQLRIGTSEEGEETPTYSAAFQIDDNLWFEANYQNITEATLTQQDGSALSGTVEYRFRNNWSLRTQVGTAGGSLDLLWQYRY